MDNQGFVKNVVISHWCYKAAGIEVQFNQVENVIGQIFAPWKGDPICLKHGGVYFGSKLRKYLFGITRDDVVSIL